MTDFNTAAIRRDALTIAANQQPLPPLECRPVDVAQAVERTIRIADRYADYIRHGTQTPPIDAKPRPR